MPRIQTFVSNDIEMKLNDIVSIKRAEGASKDEANISNTTAMIIELGIRVYELQHERREGGFSQIEFNKILLENVVKSNLVCQKILAINTQNVEVKGQDALSNLSLIAAQIKNASEAVMGTFFPIEGEEDN
ncbi:conjugal transfer relaxosome DNA-binding protein TraM [Rahnella sikkimica]|uniref:Relaxosome protein TraM n=1 Tax=Rahnella sikkimica TaxID=1805933 RepID=A0A2L1UYR5_9GAMM|nr:conjugal transfer relaxosome DNA-binding protein TraM [Rahnella sikkimica]AVF38070.1 hypothetical protein BV494_24535 [Rahnella sikkimica]